MFPPPAGQRSDSLRMVINGGLGDHLLMTPLIRFFKKTVSYQHICCVVHRNSAEIFDRNPYIDQLIPCEGNDLFLWGLPENGFDVFCPYVAVEDIQHVHDIRDIKSAHIFSFSLGKESVLRQVCRHYGIPLEDESLDMHTAPEDEEWAEEFTASYPGETFIYLNVPSFLAGKNYPLSLWQEVVDLLVEEYGDALIILEFPRPGEQLRGTQPLPFVPGLRRTAALFKHMSCVVTVDSFPGHLAAAVGTPAVVLFGPTNPLVFGHQQNTNIRTSDCPPCANTQRRKECRESKCLESIPPALIAESIKTLIRL